MFEQSCIQNREGVYGILCNSQIGNQVNFSNGTGFKVTENHVITAAHVLHQGSDPKKPIHNNFQVIRAPEVGNRLQSAQFVVENIAEDLALLRLDNPSTNFKLDLNKNKLNRGIPIGSLGFPLATVIPQQQGVKFNLNERFQGSYISGFFTGALDGENQVEFYETDSLMYKGSSGCPGFTEDGIVFGLHNRSITDPGNSQNNSPSARLSISLWVPSTTIIDFLSANGIT